MINKNGSNDEYETDLSSEELRLLKEAIKEHDNPVRYVIYSQIIPDNRKWIMFLNISSSTYARELSHATLFKKHEAAKAVAAVYEDGTDHLRIAKVTTKGDKLRVLLYSL
ncbi:hypothetical protein [Endozoicomonas euniceicola]|uniref:Uncharacterized protein n=1 Tax=Endozoicomonas euniceicola TaxID=1234143 RepID=A0ABY6GQ74_9GAMM|nr:hypothetical protein [Endozoicomonas euniceicola]UYM14905.1 hypothetical protein NX720_18725 [Endozoicomonas euniceicola]